MKHCDLNTNHSFISFINSFTCSCIHSFSHAFIYLFIHLFICFPLIYLFMHLFIVFFQSFIPLYTYLFVDSIHLFIHSHILSFLHSFIHPLILSFTHFFIHSLILSFIHSFIHIYVFMCCCRRYCSHSMYSQPLPHSNLEHVLILDHPDSHPLWKSQLSIAL